ncbi:MAG: hypothetical protein K2X94_03470 [Amoebophilaceae bacterium]|nr:hypothetical protein [Amoebophilaceae bacterium]
MHKTQRITGSFTRRIDNPYGCLILIFINMAGFCKQKTPSVEADPIPACFLQADPLINDQVNVNYPEEITGIKIQPGTSYSCAVLEVITRLYCKEIISDQNADTPPLNVANCLLEMHKITPFLGEIVTEAPDDENDPIAYLLDIPIVDNPDIREVSALIAAHQKSKSKEKTFKQLPDKLAISLTAQATTDPILNDQYQLAGTASLTIQHDLDRADSAQSKFDLKGFIAVTLKAAQDKKTTTTTKSTEDSEEAEDSKRAIAFLIIDKQWYCTNNDKLTPITKEDALKASQKGTLFFYEKIA